MRIILLLLLSLIGVNVSAQYCSADLMFDVPTSIAQKENKPKAQHTYFYRSHNSPHYSKHDSYQELDGHRRFFLGTGCSFAEIRFRLKRGKDVMQIAFIDVPGDIDLYLGEIPFKAGDFEIDIRAWFERAQESWEDQAQLSENTLLLLQESPIYPFNSLLEDDQHYYNWITESLPLKFENADFKNALALNKKVFLRLEKYYPEKGWKREDKLQWTEVPEAVDWPYGPGRYRFVQTYARSEVYYNWFYVHQ